MYISSPEPSRLGQVPNPDNMPTQPLPPGIVPPVPMPTHPLPPEAWCPELAKVQDGLCAAYEPLEISLSRTAAGHLTPDVVFIDPGASLPNNVRRARPLVASCRYLVIRDFGVDWRHVKLAARNEQLFKDWLTRFETDKSLIFRIVGYSDCVGAERNNFLLRRGRARNVFALLRTSARSRVMAVSAAPAGAYLTDNSTRASRANNRSVVIQILMSATQTI